ncbi:MAG: hypothetical protein ACXVJ3_21580, partial [Ilumatobacteraceae bacterium]
MGIEVLTPKLVVIGQPSDAITDVTVSFNVSSAPGTVSQHTSDVTTNGGGAPFGTPSVDPQAIVAGLPAGIGSRVMSASPSSCHTSTGSVEAGSLLPVPRPQAIASFT